MKLPEKFIQRMKSMLGEEYPEFEAAFLNSAPAEGLRLNPIKCSNIPDFLKNAQAVPWCRDGYYVNKSELSGNHPYHIGGMFYFQEPSAMAVAEAANICPGDFVLDLCAAPGGKATQAGAKLMGEGLIIANEIISSRACVLAENIQRFGLRNAIVTNESPHRLAEKFPEFFDKIIVDAPCSGEGMFRKEPQAILEWSQEHTFSCGERQKKIIDSAVKMLKKGGTLVYSTCTFAPCENEGVCEYVLENYPDMHLAPINLPGLSDGKGEYINSDKDFSYTKRIFPHKASGEGHFLAVFCRDGEGVKYTPAPFMPDKQTEAALKLYREFEKSALSVSLHGHFRLFGDNLYLVPMGIKLDKLKIVRGGLHLGICKKGRFEPSHALALALTPEDFSAVHNLTAISPDTKKYLHGDVIEGDAVGWCGIICDGLPIGWAKGSGGTLKNHFPKGLRLNNI